MQSGKTCSEPFSGLRFSGTAVNVTAAADFFTTDVWTWRGVVTFCKVPVIDLARRCARFVRLASR